MAEPLNHEVIEESLRHLPGWKFRDDCLAKSFRFDSFPAALSFIVRVGILAEKVNHHPEIRNVYNRVELALCTHDAGNRVTEKDVSLAGAIEQLESARPS